VATRGEREEGEYVLGTGDDELERLGLQHRLWSDAAHALWKLARLEPGQRVLDVGCGPGYAAFDLAQIVQRDGAVVGVDESPAFVEHLLAQAKLRGLRQLSARAGDVQRIGEVVAAERPFDFAWARWVMCFVANPGDVIAGVARSLRPGGRFAIQDYFNYEAMTAAPRREAYAKAVAATVRSWKAHGGDPDVVARLPRLLEEHGLRIEHFAPQQRMARPGDSLWHWGASWWRNYVPKLVEMGELGEDDARRFFEEQAAMRRETDFVALPTVYEIVAVR
jgi:SAM-dependent methyltransferase